MNIRNMFVHKFLDKDLASQMGMTEKEFKQLCKTAEDVDEKSVPWEIKLAIAKIREINSKAFPYTLKDYIEDCLEYAEQSKEYIYDDLDTQVQLQDEEFGNCPFDLTWAWKTSKSVIMDKARKRFIESLQSSFEVVADDLIDDPDDFDRMMRIFRRFF